MKKKVHLFEKFGHDVTNNNKRFDITVCGIRGNKAQTSKNVDDVTCSSCKKTKIFIDLEAKAESKRELTKDEFEEPKRLKVTFNNGFITVKNMIDNQHNDLFNFSKREERISITKDYIHLGRFFSDDEPRAKEILDFISNGFVDVSKVETVRKEKTQLDLDAEKYNLNEEQKKYLSGFDYEVVEVPRDVCNGCLFDNADEEADCEENAIKCFDCGGLGGIIFKQIHKSQDSLNKAIEKDRDSEPVEEPFSEIEKHYINEYFDDEGKPPLNYKPEDVAFKPSNHSSHYEKKEGLESIEKMELIACHGIPKMYHQKIKSNLNLALAVKYHDRLGKKDETEKEIDKMKNYMNRSVKGDRRK